MDEKPDPEKSDPEDDMAIEEARRSIGDYKVNVFVCKNSKSIFSGGQTLAQLEEMKLIKYINCELIPFEMQLKTSTDYIIPDHLKTTLSTATARVISVYEKVGHT